MATKTSSVGDRLVEEFLKLIKSVVIVGLVCLGAALIFYAAVLTLVAALTTLSSAGGMLALLGLGFCIGAASLYGGLKWRHII
jgi:hypothetical protein